jgi:DNA-binding winged helix-turn-helix (wHTH) protein/TolB-like protein/Tfp pilus assembly protein PilF
VNVETSAAVQFGDFLLDRSAGGLFRLDEKGRAIPITLGSRALDLLCVLVARQGRLVSKQAIMDAVWPSTAVEDHNLTVHISALRRVLDEGRAEGSCIQTVPGRGYRFVIPVRRHEENSTDGDSGGAPFADDIGNSHVGKPAKVLPEPPAAENPTPAPIRVRWRAVLMAGIVGLLVCGTAGVGWWMLQGTTALVASSTVASATVQDRRLSVIVLPLENSSGDPAQDSVAAAITRELTDLLARRNGGPVIPASVAAAYRGKMMDPSATGRQHDVHFALVGSARRRDGRLIVSAIVYEIPSGRRTWSRQFDRQDGLDAQEAIVQAIYESFWQVSVDEEGERAMREHPNSLDARDLIFASQSIRLTTPTKAHLDERIALIERALALEPNNFEGLEQQARFRSARVVSGYSSDPTADLTIAAKAADHLLTIDANHLFSLRAKSFVLRAQGNWSEAEAVLHRAIDLQPTEANRRAELGQVLMAEGRHQEALESLQKAKRLAGGSDPVFLYDANIAMAELGIGQFAGAIASARQSLSGYPPNSGRLGEVPWLALIAAESGSGQDDTARADLQKFLAMPRSWHSMVEIEKWPAFAANPKLLDGLRRAGMPADQAQAEELQ